MSEGTIKSAIQNSLIGLNPGYYRTLYFVQNKKIRDLQASMEMMKESMEKMKENNKIPEFTKEAEATNSLENEFFQNNCIFKDTDLANCKTDDK